MPRLALMAPLAVLLVGCSSNTPSATQVPQTPANGGVNQRACQRYVAAYSALPCMAAIPIRATDYCPATLDTTTCDSSAYWECMARAVRCDGQTPNLADTAQCEDPCI